MPPVDVAREAALNAAASKDLFLTKVWTTMIAFLENGLGTESGELTYRRESLLAERLLQELCVLPPPSPSLEDEAVD